MKDIIRGSFRSNFGVLMAVVGSAVGLGNIWRFPFLVGENGGAAFIIIYFGLVLLVGIPLILAEFIIGKSGGGAPIRSMKVLTTDNPKLKPWQLIGYISVLVGTLLLSFYFVVSGWVLESLVQSITTGFSGLSPEQIRTNFNEFTSSPIESIAYSLGFIIICMLIVGRGIEKGVERWNKILIPSLIIILIALSINSTTLSGWDEAVEFLFHPDWSKVTVHTFFDALGQVFFTLSIGMGIMITYASYVKREENMLASKLTASVIDTSVAIIAGVVIFPAVFTYGVEASEGPSLVFITLPNIFAQMPMGWPLSVAFFSMLLIAAITSAVSLLELIVTTFIEQFGLSRRRANLTVGIMMVALASLCASSTAIFNLFDSSTAKVLMPLCGILTAIFVGWVFDRYRARSIFTSQERYAVQAYPVTIFIIRYIAPLAISIIFLNGIGLI